MPRLLLIRHASTALAGTFCGHTDPPPNRGGYDQIATLLDRLAPEPLEAIYSSDLLRATLTAQPIAFTRNLPLTLLPTLREMHFGDFEGLTWQQAESLYPVQAREWVDTYTLSAPPHGELYPAFQTRVLTAVRQIARTHSGPIALVTHAGVLRILLETLSNRSVSEAHELTRGYCNVLPIDLAPEFALGPNRVTSPFSTSTLDPLIEPEASQTPYHKDSTKLQ